jgi:NAD+ diphosphatase
MSGAAEGTAANLFAGPYLDRASRLRQDPAWLAGALASPETRFVVVCGDRCLLGDDLQPAFLTRTELPPGPEADGAVVFLGLRDDTAVFAVDAEALDPAWAAPGRYADLWRVGHGLAPADAGILAYAKAMITWVRRHRYCTRTGEPLALTEGGHVLAARDGERQFPRVDPAIIVLVHDGDRCLLGRQASWPEGRYSTIAGFVEPGESLEDAVAREVMEETNIEVTDVRYHSSQPWPFPSSLMCGFLAAARSREIRTNDAELADAQWFSREDIAGGGVRIPPPLSISCRLIEAWYDRGAGPTLRAALGDRSSW